MVTIAMNMLQMSCWVPFLLDREIPDTRSNVCRLAFAYEILTPAALNFFVTYAEGAVESLWSIDQYFEFVLVLLLSTGLAFQVCSRSLDVLMMLIVPVDMQSSLIWSAYRLWSNSTPQVCICILESHCLMPKCRF